jgi:hypothetical protein
VITWTALLAIVRVLIAENTSVFPDASALTAVNAAILSVHGELFIPAAPVGVTIVPTVCKYDVPTDFAYIDEIRDYQYKRLPDVAWELSMGTTPIIVFREPFFEIVLGQNPIVYGGKVQGVVSAGGDDIGIDMGYVLYRTVANIHAALGGTASDMAAWHQAEHERYAELAEARLADEMIMAKYKPKPGARLVPGRMS